MASKIADGKSLSTDDLKIYDKYEDAVVKDAKEKNEANNQAIEQSKEGLDSREFTRPSRQIIQPKSNMEDEQEAQEAQSALRASGHIKAIPPVGAVQY